MDLKAILDDEFIQPLRGAIVAEDMVATRQLIESIGLVDTSTDTKIEVSVVAESYIINLRDGTQYKNPSPTLDDIQIWLDAKGLLLDAYEVLENIHLNRTTWDRKSGSDKLQEIINDKNVRRIGEIAIEQLKEEINQIKWL